MLPLEQEQVSAAYADIMRQLDEVNAGFTVAELQTGVRYLHAVKHVR